MDGCMNASATNGDMWVNRKGERDSEEMRKKKGVKKDNLQTYNIDRKISNK